MEPVLITSLQQMQEMLRDKILNIVVFSTHTCNVCKPLKQQVSTLLQDMEEVGYAEVFIDDIEDVKGPFGVYSVPIVALFVEGRETLRYSAAIDIRELKDRLIRLIDLMS